MHHGIRVEVPGEEGREEKSAQVCAGLHVQVTSADTVPGFPLLDQKFGDSMKNVHSLA